MYIKYFFIDNSLYLLKYSFCVKQIVEKRFVIFVFITARPGKKHPLEKEGRKTRPEENIFKEVETCQRCYPRLCRL